MIYAASGGVLSLDQYIVVPYPSNSISIIRTAKHLSLIQVPIMGLVVIRTLVLALFSGMELKNFAQTASYYVSETA